MKPLTNHRRDFLKTLLAGGLALPLSSFAAKDGSSRPAAAAGGSGVLDNSSPDFNRISSAQSAMTTPAAPLVRNTFAQGPDAWCAYDYHGSMVADGINIFVLGTAQPTGGPDGTGFVWVDHRRWSADTPESPLSILPLLTYRNWINAGPLDLRGTEVTCYLRGDNLRLDGAQCLFWVHANGGRWHFNSHPLTITEGRWAAPLRFTLTDDEALWHHSWPRDPQRSKPLTAILGAVKSYGFSFIGFSSLVTGRLSLAQFEIRPAVR